jgi:hypothetical protein
MRAVQQETLDRSDRNATAYVAFVVLLTTAVLLMWETLRFLGPVPSVLINVPTLVRFALFGVAAATCARQGIQIVQDADASWLVRLIAGCSAAGATAFLVWLMVGQFVNAFSFVSPGSFAELATIAFSIAVVFCLRAARSMRRQV